MESSTAQTVIYAKSIFAAVAMLLALVLPALALTAWYAKKLPDSRRGTLFRIHRFIAYGYLVIMFGVGLFYCLIPLGVATDEPRRLAHSVFGLVALTVLLIKVAAVRNWIPFLNNHLPKLGLTMMLLTTGIFFTSSFFFLLKEAQGASFGSFSFKDTTPANVAAGTAMPDSQRKQVFEVRCTMCHLDTQNRLNNMLAGNSKGYPIKDIGPINATIFDALTLDMKARADKQGKTFTEQERMAVTWYLRDHYSQDESERRPLIGDDGQPVANTGNPATLNPPPAPDQGQPAAQPTAAPTQAATATTAGGLPRGRLRVDERFRDNSSRWRASPGGQAQVGNGQAALTGATDRFVTVTADEAAQYDSAVIEVEGTSQPPGAVYGMVFRYQGESNFYAFMVDAQKRYRLIRRDGQQDIELIPWKNSSQVNGPGQANSFAVVFNGPEIQLWLNGQALDRYTDRNANAPPRGFAGLYLGAGAGPPRATYTSLRVSELA